MLEVAAVLLTAAWALFAYLALERMGVLGIVPAVLRAVALAALILLLVNPSSLEEEERLPRTVLLDASLSMGAAGGMWREALDTARILAGDEAAILRFGNAAQLFDTLPPIDGASRLQDALDAVLGSGVPVVVVTDGEIEDAAAIAKEQLAQVGMVILGRDDVPNAALLDVSLQSLVYHGDSIPIELTVGTWGELAEGDAQVSVSVGDRPVRTVNIELAPSPGTARRRIVLPPVALQPGANVLTFQLTAAGDMETGDNQRVRLVRVVEQSAIVVIVAPADWEGRFLASEVASVSQAGVASFGSVSPGRWVDMASQAEVNEELVKAAVRGARLIVVRGGGESVFGDEGDRPVWRWPAGSDPRLELFQGDWYLTRSDIASPFAGRLVGVEWDSVPPLTGIVPLVVGTRDWSALIARQGRRGAERPVLLGRDSAGIRRLTTAGTGLWRWAFRGGTSREAYRAVLAAGIDWLMGSESLRSSQLSASDVVQRGEPILFRWEGQPTDSVVVRITGRDSSWTDVLRFSSNEVALYPIDPGVYTWSASDIPRATGMFVVEAYSDEFHPRPKTVTTSEGMIPLSLIERSFRQRWWWYVVIVLALAAEWAFRQRRGLP